MHYLGLLPLNNLSRRGRTGKVAGRCTYPRRDRTMFQCATLIATPRITRTTSPLPGLFVSGPRGRGGTYLDTLDRVYLSSSRPRSIATPARHVTPFNEASSSKQHKRHGKETCNLKQLRHFHKYNSYSLELFCVSRLIFGMDLAWLGNKPQCHSMVWNQIFTSPLQPLMALKLITCSVSSCQAISHSFIHASLQ